MSDLILSEVLYSIWNLLQKHPRLFIQKAAASFYSENEVSDARDLLIKAIGEDTLTSLKVPRLRKGSFKSNRTDLLFDDIFKIFLWAEEGSNVLPTYVSSESSKVVHDHCALNSVSSPGIDVNPLSADSVVLSDIRISQNKMQQSIQTLQDTVATLLSRTEVLTTSASNVGSSSREGISSVQFEGPAFPSYNAESSTLVVPFRPTYAMKVDDSVSKMQVTHANELPPVGRPMGNFQEQTRSSNHPFVIKKKKGVGGNLVLRKEVTRLIIGDSQTRRILASGIDASNKTQIWTKPGGTLDSVTHALMDSSRTTLSGAEQVEEIILFVGGNTLAKRNCTVSSFLNDLASLVKVIRDIFSMAKVRLCDFVPRIDMPDSNFVKELNEAIIEVYGFGFLIPLVLRPSDVGDDGVHLNRDGLDNVCRVIQKSLGIESDKQPFFWPGDGPQKDDVPSDKALNSDNSKQFLSRNKGVVKGEGVHSDSTVIAAVDERGGQRRLLVCNLSLSVTAEKLVSFIGDGVLQVEERQARNPNRSRSFVVTVNRETYKRVYEDSSVSSFWPTNVFVKRFFLPVGKL